MIFMPFRCHFDGRFMSEEGLQGLRLRWQGGCEAGGEAAGQGGCLGALRRVLGAGGAG